MYVTRQKLLKSSISYAICELLVHVEKEKQTLVFLCNPAIENEQRVRKEVKSTCKEAKSVSSGDVTYQFSAKWVQCPLSPLKTLDQMLEATKAEDCSLLKSGKQKKKSYST